MTINNWAVEDRPREKMLFKGSASLSDAELLAILIGSGTVGENAVDIAKNILHAAHNSLQELGKKSIKDLKKFNGIGEAKAITIAAALELGRRRVLSDVRERPKVCSSKDAANAILPMLADLPHEEFWILLLNRANEITGRERLSSGGTSGTVVDLKVLFKVALDGKASGIMAVHNHPSGNLQPSTADRDLTQKMLAAGKVLELPLLDHLIVSERGYFSFADEGLL